MIENSDFETFLHISKSKYQIFVYDKNNLKNLYNKEIENSDDIELNVLSKFLDNNIYKFEKMINNPHPKGTKEHKKWNRVIIVLLLVGVTLGFVFKSIKNLYF